ncbi:zinc dependent phospholipase C family protein [Oleidesulfovibrio sp.]|uniref:zinc dependent phospholipase C family protein n=1 Tax=Oleidesulfovibrio sp. TaxID=2909707 RepID=UPI003A852F1F
MSVSRLCSLLAACASLLVVMLLPEDALAWGPGVHMACSDWLFGNLSLLPSTVAAAISTYEAAFRYGALSADIFIGKGCAVTPGHSHNWETAHTLLKKADSPRLQAYAYGYMSHLAADTVAHNHYVPNCMHVTGGSKLSHVYVEMLADSLLPSSRGTAAALYRLGTKDADSVLQAAVTPQRVPFFLKKQIFMGSVALAGNSQWRRSVKLVDKVLPSNVDAIYFGEMLNVSLKAIVDVFWAPFGSVVTAIDPIGEHNLATVRKQSRRKTSPRILFGTLARSLRGKQVEARLTEDHCLFPLDPRLAALTLPDEKAA